MAFLIAMGFGAYGQQPTAAASAKQVNRYLLVVDVSKAMLPRALGSLAATGELLATGLDGQIREGDEIAVWTFSEELYAGRFPIQRWTPAEQGAIAARVLTHLRDQTVGKAADIAKVMTAVGYLVKDSDNITIILITDGEQKLHGTPFDNQINDFCSRQEKKQKKAKMPFVIALRAAGGRMTDFSVSVPPRPIRMPAAPALPTPVPVAAPPPAVAAVSPTPAAVSVKTNLVSGAMVFTGSNPKPIVVPATNSPDGNIDAAKLAADASVATKSTRSVVSQSALSLAGGPSVESVPLGTAIEAPSVRMGGVSAHPPRGHAPTNAVVKAEPAMAPVSAATVAAVPETSTSAAEPAPVTNAPPQLAAVAAAVSPPPAQAPAPKLVTTPASKQVTLPKATEVVANKPAIGSPNVSPGATPPQSKVGAASVAVAASAEPTTVRANELRPAAAPLAQSASQAEVAMATPVQSFVNSWVFWAAALLLVTIALYCALLVLRRSRSDSSPSLITCSIDRNRKG